MSEQFERRTFEAALVKRALGDPEFRSSLLHAPRETYLDELKKLRPDQKIPEEVEMRVVEEKGDLFYVVIPHVPDGVDLSEEQIDAIVERRRTHRKPCWGLGDAPD